MQILFFANPKMNFAYYFVFECEPGNREKSDRFVILPSGDFIVCESIVADIMDFGIFDLYSYRDGSCIEEYARVDEIHEQLMLHSDEKIDGVKLLAQLSNHSKRECLCTKWNSEIVNTMRVMTIWQLIVICTNRYIEAISQIDSFCKTILEYAQEYLPIVRAKWERKIADVALAGVHDFAKLVMDYLS